MNSQARNALLYDLRVDDLVCPVGIDTPHPIFSWKTSSDRLGWRQSAYRIVVRTDGAGIHDSERPDEEIVWDSGRVTSSVSVGIAYEGSALRPSSEYLWEVTVWDADGAAAFSSSRFETGLLCSEAFRDAAWISFPEEALGGDTAYTIDFDFKILQGAQGFCFGMEDRETFVLWQVSAGEAEGRVLLRPHFKSGGRWTALPDGEGCRPEKLPVFVSESVPGKIRPVDLTKALDREGRGILGKTIHERIEVDGRTIRTFFGEDPDRLTLAAVYTHSEAIPLRNIGFRQYTAPSGAKEVACYGNLVVRGKSGSVLYENPCSSHAALAFEGALGGKAPLALEDGMLRAGSEKAVGEHIYVRTAPGGLPVFRKTFRVKDGLLSARLYTSGLGVYESYLNGERVGRKKPDGSVEYHELKPGFTEAEKRRFYNAYDVTSFLKKGETNALSAVVSGGWWSDAAARRYGKKNAYLAKLLLTYRDGTHEILTTDESWKTAKAAPVLFADIFSGETYDAGVSTAWRLAGFDDSAWPSAVRNREFHGEITAWSGSFITVRKDLERRAESVTVYSGVTGESDGAYGKICVTGRFGGEPFTLRPGETALVDFGQNFAGWEAIRAEGEAGTAVTIRHGEILNDRNGEKARGCDGPEGSIYNANYRSAAATTRYYLSGEGIESYHPSFTFYGFRYIEITADRPVTLHGVTGQVVTSVEKDTGFIKTSDECVNRLIQNIRWGQYSNYLSVPTDCPQRDERQGWTADTQVFTKAGNYLAFSKSFLEKFLLDLRDSQDGLGRYPGTAPTGAYNGADWGGTGWADAGVIVPYTLYTMYGDRSVIRKSWDSMQRYVDGFLASTEKRGPRNIWGDWLAYESNDRTIQDMLAASFYAWDALMMADMADAIGLPEEAERYRALYKTEKEYFIAQYVRPSGELLRGEQSVCLYALYLDLLPDSASAERVTAQLTGNIERNGNRLQTGFLGTAILLHTLTKIGRSDLAYALLLQHDNPSWLYSVDQGATTVWERWNSYTLEHGFGDVGMNSFNHYAYGAVAGWMFECMAGIGADLREPGFKHVILAPQPDRRLSAEASFDSAYGRIQAASSVEDKTWTYSFTLPANTTAEVCVPAASAEACRVNGRAPSELLFDTDGIALRSSGEGKLLFEAASGRFTLTVALG